MPAPDTQSALLMTGPGKAAIFHDLSVPSPDPGQLLIRTHAVALNPSDWMALTKFARPGAGMGFDFAGEVVEIGDGVEGPWSVGDHVAGLIHACHAANYSNGAFRQYLLADADLVLRLPPQLSLAQASTAGMGFCTAAQALYQSLELPLPGLDVSPTSMTVLVYGAGAATGCLAVQLAKLSGLRVIVTCSDRSMPRVASLGPDKVVDYKDPGAIQTIRDFVSDTGLYLIFDCVGVNETAAFCYQCFTAAPQGSAAIDSRSPPKEFIYSTTMPVANLPPRPESLPGSLPIRNKFKLVYTCFGRRFWFLGRTWEASREDRQFMVWFYRRVEELLTYDKLRLMPIEVRDGGLEGVLEGVEDLRVGKVHGVKLVYLTS